MTIKRIELHYIGGNSDKVYIVELLYDGDGKFSVYTEYGRRGNIHLRNNYKVRGESFASAQAIFDKIVREKKNKGYQVVSQSENYLPQKPQNQPQKENKLDFKVQLFNSIEEQQVKKYLDDPEWGMMMEFDGERRIVITKFDGTSLKAIGFNRKGKEVDLPYKTSIDLIELSNGAEIILDAEIISNKLFVFDALKIGGQDLTTQGFEARWEAANKLISSKNLESIELIHLAKYAYEKRYMFNGFREQNMEGVVFRKLDAPYFYGKPDSGGTALKFKFIESAFFIVAGINDEKRSISLALIKPNETQMDVGDVSIQPYKEIPQLGQIVEVCYKNVFHDGSLFHPVYKRVRNDLSINDCAMSQLRLKKLSSFKDVKPKITSNKAYAW